MPWHVVQCAKMTCRTAPCGGVTFGRCARPACAPAGTIVTYASPATSSAPAETRASRPTIALHHLQRLQRSGARADLLHLDVVEMQDAQEHVRGPLRVVRKHQ